MKIVSRFRLQPITALVSMLALVCLIAAAPATLDLGEFSIKPKDAKATTKGGRGGGDGDDGGGDDSGGDDGDDGGGDDDGGDDGGGDDGGGDDGGSSGSGGESAGADAGDSGGDDGDKETRDAAENGASGSTITAVRIPLPMIGNPRSIPTMFVVYFDWDSDKLDEQAAQVLSEAEAAIGKLGDTKVSVIGNTDRSGPSAYNEGLAKRRAQAVAEALAARGLPTKVIGRKGYGEARPLVKTEDGVRKRLNRRVEIVVEAAAQTAEQ